MKKPGTIFLTIVVIIIIGLLVYKNRTPISSNPVEYENKTPVTDNETLNWKVHLKMPEVNFTPADQLVIVTMNNYIPQDVYDHFTKTYGTRIVASQVTSNEELLKLLTDSPGQHDVMTVGDYMVTTMIHKGLLYKLDHDKLPNMTNLDADVLRSEYDLGLRYSVPLFRTSLGIVFNINYVSGIPRTLGFIAEQISNDYFAFRTGLVKEMRFALGVSLMSLGYSPNTINPVEIIEARDRLITMVNQYGLTFMGEDNDDEALITNGILIGMGWNGIVAAALLNDADINFLLPEGQVLVTIDSAVISARSKRIKTAELFVNYLLIPQVAARMSNYNCFANCISDSMPYIKRIIRNGPGFIFPDESNRLFIKDLGPAVTMYEDAWKMVLQAKPADSLIKLPLPKSGLFQGGTRSSEFAERYENDIEIPR